MRTVSRRAAALRSDELALAIANSVSPCAVYCVGSEMLSCVYTQYSCTCRRVACALSVYRTVICFIS